MHNKAPGEETSVQTLSSKERKYYGQKFMHW